jgi:predicted ribosome-associated RNA-binding protein Tma20
VTLFYDLDGRNNIFPTLYFLWKFPTAINCFIIHEPVSEFVMKGADLMLPGLATLSGTSLYIK